VYHTWRTCESTEVHWSRAQSGGDQKCENRENLGNVAETNKPKKEKKKVQTKDVEEAIKAYDGIVEVGEGSGVQGKRGKALWSVM